MNKVALITGATRGIGRALSIGLAKNGYNVVVTGKSTENKPNLPGNIYSVAKEIESYGVSALPLKVDVRYESDIDYMVKSIKKKYNRLDLVINNAGALWWKSILDTPISKYDLINNINSRASFLVSQRCIPLMIENGGGNIIMQSPPLPQNINELKYLKDKTGYMISKWGMTLAALGISQEYGNQGIVANTLWPMRPIESYALINNNLGAQKDWRKTDIMVDCVMEILNEKPENINGRQLIDETYLISKGITDFSKYQCVPGYEPSKL
jgi:citronellol/citronellal dehydrogenase